MVDLADEQLAGLTCRPRSLSMATKAEIVVRLPEHLRIRRAMHVVANDTALTKRLVLKDKRLGLLLMAFGAGLIPLGHRESACRFEDLFAMGIVAIDAVHLAFDNRVAMRELKTCPDPAMALKACLRILAGIDNRFLPIASGIDMLAAGAMAQLASDRAGLLRAFHSDLGVSAFGKVIRVAGVAMTALRIADEGGSGSLGRHHDRPIDRGARDQKPAAKQGHAEEAYRLPCPLPMFHDTRENGLFCRPLKMT